MKITRKAVTTLAGISLATLLVAAFVPKATHSAASMQSSLALASDSPPIVFQHYCTDTVAEFFAHCSISVPAGKRLIVQTVSLSALNNSGVRVIQGALNETVGTGPNPTSTAFLSFGVPFTGAGTSGFDLSLTTQELRFYANGGDGSGAVQCSVAYNQIPTTSSFACQVVGYLVAVSPS